MINIEITNEEVFNKRPLLSLEDKTKWITALKSGDYKKGKGVLNVDNKLCCLGVICELESLKKTLRNTSSRFFYGQEEESHYLPKDSKFYNILGDSGRFKGFAINSKTALANLNDTTETFEEVIETIEKYF